MTPAILPFPNIGPDLISFEIFGIALALRYYALAYIVGLIVALWIVKALMRRPALWPGNTAPMPPEAADDLLTWMIVGVIVGGRLGFVMFYQPGYYLSNPIEILYVWQGGMSFHGGFLGVITGTVLFCRSRGHDMISVGDAVAWSATPGLFLGRIANFVNGELWGRGTDVPWAFVFPDPRSQTCTFWGDQPCARHPSQLYEGALEGLLLFVLMALAVRAGWLSQRGRLIGLFLLGYGAARFFVEFFRQPDLQFVTPGNPLGLAFHLDGWGLTMGQTLSVPMILLGLWAMRRRSA